MAFGKFKLIINTPEGIFFEDEIIQIEIKTPNGYTAILVNHAPTIGAIVPSLCYIRDIRNNRVPAVINGGMFYVNDNRLNIVTDFFDFVDNINESVFAKRQQRIKQAIKNKSFSSSVSFEKIRAKLEKELNDFRKITKS